MKIYQDYNLSKLNTFGVSVDADFFVEVQKEEDLVEIFNLPEFTKIKKVFLGGGSNILFSKDFDGIVVLNKLKGVEILREDSKNVVIKCMGGEIWHDLVIFAVDRNLWGIENLSLIPGTVGAAPMQNIGAYGVELKDVLDSVEAFDINTGQKRIFSKEECKMGYRDSVFKNELKGKYFITAITVVLTKTPKPNLSYKVLLEYLEKKYTNKEDRINIKNISDAVSSIRKSKLPDPAIIPNAGSFFKNVFISSEQFKKLLLKFPEMPSFEEERKIIKIPAGWLIEQCNWKGKRMGNVGVHDKQALVLVNYGGANGGEVLALANQIIADVKAKFGLELTPEVNLV